VYGITAEIIHKCSSIYHRDRKIEREIQREREREKERERERKVHSLVMLACI
jgi:hypothetical protein